MVMIGLLLISGFLGTIWSTEAYSDGAPACRRVPNHGGQTRFSRKHPHEISFPNGETCYHNGQIIDVKIGPGKGASFRGLSGFNGFSFFVENILHSRILVGGHKDKYRVWDRTRGRCVGATHKNSDGKSKVFLKWQAPSDGINIAKFFVTTFTKTGNGFQKGYYFRSEVVSLPKCALPNATAANETDGKKFRCESLKDDWPTWCPNHKDQCDKQSINCARTCCEHKGAAALVPGNAGSAPLPCPREDRFEGWCESKTNRCNQDVIQLDYCRKTCCLFQRKKDKNQSPVNQ